eukprot:TRINITY_DN1354_c0_g1_i2.p1 TRINITY_DN1354_c0_g1~~TRINITY_DN1354_c0_g1_i2.p1  ORF type:complete len:919 (+),score=264.06 TRINITY_DN1354_c0_g1_i2:132-2888(+)
MNIPGRNEPRLKQSFDDYDDENILQQRMTKIGYRTDSSSEEQRVALLWALLASYLPEDIKSIEKFFVHHVEYTLARGRGNLTKVGAFQALAMSIRDRLIERFKDTQLYFKEKGCKRVAYMSLEFLLGRSLQNAIVNLGLESNFATAMKNLGFVLEDLYEEEHDAGLGNGGLGRLAACFLDSLATLDYPAWGYGLRYKYGMFYQTIREGAQVEIPDYWLIHGNPWEIERLDVVYPVSFYGYVREDKDKDGKVKFHWEGSQKVMAVAYDTMVPGYDTFNTLNIRLWSAQPSKEFDLDQFNKGDFFKSIEDKQNSEQITSVLYPNDNTPSGKELRLKQQYFLVSATIQDLMRRFKETDRPIEEFPDRIAVQLNDTHPTLGICELMRILTDIEGLEWAQAWDITTKVFAYTNHTVLPEALEKWSVDLLQHLIPRILTIIYAINHEFLKTLQKRWPDDVNKMRSLSIIEEGNPRMVRMAHLAIIGSHSVNGVAAIHSELLKTQTFPDFYEMWPQKFTNMTNGVTPRRWIHHTNPELSMLLSSWLRTQDWVVNLDLLTGLRAFADNPNLHKLWASVKQRRKEKLAAIIEKKCGVKVSTTALFDVQVKRIHEYKRQLLNILYIIHRYHAIKKMAVKERVTVVPRVVIFGGKAAPGYYMAKLIIQLINNVAKVVNADAEIGNLLKVVFIPNYCVSLAEEIIPASDLSQHISTAGMEASGTSNMKFAMNGGLIIGTMDGANIEIRDEIGHENMFIFGALAHEIEDLRSKMRENELPHDPRFVAILKSIEDGEFGEPSIFAPIQSVFSNPHDYYLVSYDFPSYVEAQNAVDKCYQNHAEWTRKSIMSTAGSGTFSSDRTIRQYAQKIWGIEPVRRPGPVAVSMEKLHNMGVVSRDILSPMGSPSSSISLERMTPRQGHAPIRQQGFNL